MPSSNRSSSVPLSFDRFRVRSIQFRSPFRGHQREKNVKQSPDRSWTRKTQVHPNSINSSESKRIDRDAAHLFYANKRSNSMTSSSLENSQNNTCSKTYFNTRPTSNVVGVFDRTNISLINPSYSTQSETPESVCPPTPCMVRYRHSSVPIVIPTRIIKRPKSFDDSNKQSDLDHVDQLNA
ncbi:unnamed protein product [Rotaria sp. Silwood2]|nr:unnamed protein product [Rotaria sp. Silwood2]CAF2811575.1 unnamed protein product [Rotaria sp. Silwood2]CAF3298370.1 unnamed protein product [Rotaria sp. Silwood2]CAF4453231.1 unnamed protein product [Rotaria sp. Silwood2]CAF4491735.1 unnamed protein product [Rotaria sp. Silwood2]